MEKFSARQSLIFDKLRSVDVPLTSMELSAFVKASVRTVKSDISQINKKLAPLNLHIYSEPHKGYWVNHEELKRVKEIDEMLDEKIVRQYDDTPKTSYERINYIIKKLLVIDYHIKLEDLMDEIYVSRSTLTQDLKEVRKCLAKFRLNVVTRANYGILIEGNEIDKRLCISEYFFHFNQQANFQVGNENIFTIGKIKEEYDTIISFIKEICQQYDIVLSDFSLNNLALHVSIGIRRCTFYNYVKVEEKFYRQVSGLIEYEAASSLIKKLENYYHCMLPIGETIYYAMHLQSKRISDVNQIDNASIQQIQKCIAIILAEIKNNFALDFDDDEELVNYLMLHIPQMIIRCRNHMVIRNPLVYDNLRRYLFATKVTHSAVAVIENIYDVEVDINEFGYLALYFNLAINRYLAMKKIKIGLVCGRGRPESIMYYNEISEVFSRRYEVIEMDYHEVMEKVIEGLDFIITTYELPELNIPTYFIRNDNYIEEIRKECNEIHLKQINFDLFFKPEYFIGGLGGHTKDEVMVNLYELFLKKGLINKMPDRSQNFKTDELGNGIVHMQDLFRIVRKTMCFVAVLKEPILWDRDIVRVLILTKTKKSEDQDLFAICKIVSKWANCQQCVDRLIRSGEYEVFLKDIKEV